MAQSYAIPVGTTEVVYEIKKSRFIARLCLAEDRAQALSVLAQAKQDYPDARHHCWAYMVGPPEQPAMAAMSDDGEPSGTAGKPILNVVQHKDLGDVMLVVIRYFGGIKLGAGGLVRAYSQAAQQAYDQAVTEMKIQLDKYTLACDFSDEQAMRHWLNQRNGQILAVHYSQQVSLSIALDSQYYAELQAYLGAFSSASIKPDEP
jgi:uncharacterized YigZ family protein